MFSNTITRELEKGQKHLDLIWKVWREEYLLNLREKLPIVHKGLNSTYMKAYILYYCNWKLSHKYIILWMMRVEAYKTFLWGEYNSLQSYMPSTLGIQV